MFNKYQLLCSGLIGVSLIGSIALAAKPTPSAPQKAQPSLLKSGKVAVKAVSPSAPVLTTSATNPFADPSIKAVQVMNEGGIAGACGACTDTEGEPAGCGNPDTFNGGCNLAVPGFSPITLNSTVCGTTAANTANRDTDWWQFTLAAPATVTWSVTGNFTPLVGFVAQPCPQTAFFGTPVTGSACSPTSVTANLSAGTWVAFVANSAFVDVPCPTSYEGILATAGSCLLPLPPSSCRTDLNGDNTTGVSDLLTVINNWGLSGPPRPAADIAPLPNGDCVVGVSDLLSVIGSWGPCPVNPNECTGATPAVDGSNNFDNTTATTSAPAGSCGTMSNDIWFNYVATATSVQVSTCGGTGMDSVLEAYDSCGGASLACNDDTCGLQSTITLNGLTVGNSYKIRLGTWNNSPGAIGTFTISPVAPPAGNDTCAGATLITLPFSESVNETSYTPDQTPGSASSCVAGVFTMSGSWWYQFVATSNTTVTFTSCGSPTEDTLVTAYTGACGAQTQVGCDDDTCTAPAFGGSVFTFPVTAGTTYYIHVETYSGGVLNPVSVSISSP